MQAMRIVVLDGYTLNPGDLSWALLRRFGELTVYERTEPELLLQRAADAEAVLVNKVPLNAAALGLLNKLKYIGVLATGYDRIDLAAASALGITVSNVPTYGTDSVAQLVFALLLELCQHVALHSEAVREGEWSRSKDWCFWKTPLVELAGKTLGVVGFGRIGRRVAEIGRAFRMQILAVDQVRTNPPPALEFQWATLEETLRAADVLSLHCPLTPENQGIINAERLAMMKPSALLINTSRGGLVVDKDLAEALDQGRLAAAALDVLSTEPPSPSNPLLHAKNCILTPHLAWATREARERLMSAVAENLAAFVSHRPRNVVNSPRGK
jgi:glycerate dehydrogenase